MNAVRYRTGQATTGGGALTTATCVSVVFSGAFANWQTGQLASWCVAVSSQCRRWNVGSMIMPTKKATTARLATMRFISAGVINKKSLFGWPRPAQAEIMPKLV